ncbi:hypothetical protein ACFV7Q_11730 [Streptomyces sp. NPDC059851]|uniref:hypothetical protein n=1 Tax=Streptomyces sp. NPDC059851 TaxID=3346971 RepID=UPI003662BF7C
MAFGIADPSGALAGVSVTYTWQAWQGGDAGQCGNHGTHVVPVAPVRAVGNHIRVDTDGRPGGCDLTFAVSGRTDVGLDVQSYGDDDLGQCPSHLPAGQYRTASSAAPVTVRVDTDKRSGGCWLALRLRRLGR